MGSLNDSFQSSYFLLLLLVFFLAFVNGKTYKKAIKRLIKIRAHYLVRKHTHRLTNGRQPARADRQLDERSDGQTGRFEQIRYPQSQLLSLSENEKSKEST